MNRRSRQEGFTLIEIMVVILVLSVLAALVAPNVFRHVGASKQAAARSQIEMIGAALDAYRLDSDQYPATEQGLAALRAAPATGSSARTWSGPYLKKEVPLDPWGRPYVYRVQADREKGEYELFSYGRDGQEGGSGEDADVRSWE